MAEEKKIGEVIHYFPKVGAAVVKFEANVKVGDRIKIKGNRGASHEAFELVQEISSLQQEKNAVDSAKSGDELGMKVEKEVHEGDSVFLVE
jgi:putative protease